MDVEENKRSKQSENKTIAGRESTNGNYVTMP